MTTIFDDTPKYPGLQGDMARASTMEAAMADDMDTGIIGTIRTARHQAVRYHIGHESGDVFGVDSDYDGPTLTVEVADLADAQAMLTDLCASGRVRALTRAAGDENKAGWIVSFDDLQAIRAAAGDWGYDIDLEAVEAIALDVERRILAALTPAPQHEGRDHRSFPEAADGRPMPPMGDDLMIAGLNGEDARFVALQLAQNGLMLVPATPTAQEAVPTEDELDEAWKSGFNAGFGEAKLTTNPPQPSVSVAEAGYNDVIHALIKQHETVMRSKGRNPIDYTTKWSLAADAVAALRALKGGDA